MIIHGMLEMPVLPKVLTLIHLIGLGIASMTILAVAFRIRGAEQFQEKESDI